MYNHETNAYSLCTRCLFFNSVKADPIGTDSLATLVNQGNRRVVAAIVKQSKELGDTLRSVTKSVNVSVAPIEQSAFLAKSIALMPLILFLLLLMVIAVKLKNDNVKLSEFLVDKEQEVEIKKEEVKVDVANAVAQTAAANALAAKCSGIPGSRGGTDPPCSTCPGQLGCRNRTATKREPAGGIYKRHYLHIACRMSHHLFHVPLVVG